MWLEELQEMKKQKIDMNNLGGISGSEVKQLIKKMQNHKVVKPLTLSSEFVGVTLDVNIEKMFKLLSNDQVFIIGIYGMGGVGKTLLATLVENEAKWKGTFKDVFWVTVSDNFSISKLQHDIAKRMGLKLDEEDERIRAKNLSLALEAREKSVIILDDVWKYIDFQKVGIPLKVNGIKVILTSRLKHVCQQMDCMPNNMVQVLPILNEQAAWELFKLKLGHNGTPAKLPREVLDIARSIVDRCNGLPLGISVMARTMKGLHHDIHRWKHVWHKLENLEMGEEVYEEVFKVLKRSYDNLIDKGMQNCFLYCALLFNFERNELNMKLVDNGLINGRKSLEEIFDEGKTILDKLQSHSLVGTCLCELTHRLVTDMACHILKESQRNAMVKFKKGLTKITHMKEWRADLELVYLMRCNIEEISDGTSPCCPRLSTLIIIEDPISHIPECFFIHMNSLAILDLSFNERLESLPNSLTNLRSLISLVLKGCLSLKYVPPLRELQALSRLDISGCSIEEVPQGLEMLINLKWLDLSNNKKLSLIPEFVLPNLTNLQYLDLRCPWIMIKVEEIQGMKMLECFGGTFLNCNHYNDYMQKILDAGVGPKTYHICLGNICYDGYWENVDIYSIAPGNYKNVYFGDCEDFSHILPRDLTDLCIYDNNQWICLCDALSYNAASSTRRIHINNCIQVKSLFCLSGLSGSCSFCTNIGNLVTLRLEYLPSLTVVCKDVAADVRQCLSPLGMFSCLKYFQISECHEIEKLLTPELVQQLRCIDSLVVRDCHSIKEIFAVSNSGDDGDDCSNIILPKLTRMVLVGLPQLKTVCEGIIFCGSSSSPTLIIERCPCLERFPTIRHKPDFGFFEFDGFS